MHNDFMHNDGDHNKLKTLGHCLIIFTLAKIVLLGEWLFVVHTSMSFIDSIMRYDSWWFKSIAEHGYMHSVLLNDPIRPGQANWAFFPLFPLLVKVVSSIGVSTYVAAIIVNQSELFLSLYFAYLLALNHLPARAAIFVPLSIAMSPGNTWFLAAYSDITFLFLTILAFYCLTVRRYWCFAIVGYFLSMSRFVGFLIIIPLLIHYWRKHMSHKSQICALMLQLLIVISGLLSFMLVLYLVMGDPWAYYHIQSAWGHLGTNWVSQPWQSIMSTWNSGVDHDRICLILLPVWLLILVIERYYEEAAFSFMCMLAPLAAGSLWSFSRYALGLYPLYFAIALVARKNYLFGLGVLIITVVIQAYYWSIWLTGGWV